MKAHITYSQWRNCRLEILKQELGDMLAQREALRAELESLQCEIEESQDEIFNLENYSM